MAVGGYFAGNDYVPYQSGPLAISSATSLNERKKKKTVKCPNVVESFHIKRFAYSVIIFYIDNYSILFLKSFKQIIFAIIVQI